MLEYRESVVADDSRPEMTLDEINEEIRKAREERAAHEACLNGRARGSSTKLESLCYIILRRKQFVQSRKYHRQCICRLDILPEYT